jgi:prophage antirepressor-like protein
MSNNIVPFDFSGNAIRVVVIDGDPWFVLADVLKAMGSKTRPADAKAVLQEDLGKDVVADYSLETNGGVQRVLIVNDAAITFLLSRSRTEMGKQLNRWMHSEILPSIRQTGSYSIAKPKTAIELARENLKLAEQQVALLEKMELLEEQKQLLEAENYALSEAVDELFEYSSIIRVAKFNDVRETSFNWRLLKAASNKLGLEIKKVPSPRFEFQNLYHHQAWRLAYPEYRLPETTTLTIKRA